VPIRIVHPFGLEPPPEWEGRDCIPVEELAKWLATGPKQARSSRGGKRNSTAGYYPDLDYYMRSLMEANWARFLTFLGYREWRGKDDPPPGRWWRYEGRRWEFKQRTRNGHYKCDFEVWPGYFDPTRPYEVHELKGWLDPDSKVRLKRMAEQYPEVPVELVTSKRFNEETKKAKRHIPTWDVRPEKKGD